MPLHCVACVMSVVPYRVRRDPDCRVAATPGVGLPGGAAAAYDDDDVHVVPEAGVSVYTLPADVVGGRCRSWSSVVGGRCRRL
jgi:hypothetical protein